MLVWVASRVDQELTTGRIKVAPFFSSSSYKYIVCVTVQMQIQLACFHTSGFQLVRLVNVSGGAAWSG
jgi:hypothetical protein